MCQNRGQEEGRGKESGEHGEKECRKSALLRAASLSARIFTLCCPVETHCLLQALQVACARLWRHEERERRREGGGKRERDERIAAERSCVSGRERGLRRRESARGTMETKERAKGERFGPDTMPDAMLVRVVSDSRAKRRGEGGRTVRNTRARCNTGFRKQTRG